MPQYVMDSRQDYFLYTAILEQNEYNLLYSLYNLIYFLC